MFADHPCILVTKYGSYGSFSTLLIIFCLLSIIPSIAEMTHMAHMHLSMPIQCASIPPSSFLNALVRNNRSSPKDFYICTMIKMDLI
jgi:hypothetical protein